MENTKQKPNDYKSCFIMGSDVSFRVMRDYITHDLELPKIFESTYCGRDVISVPKEVYERVLLKGKEFACKKGLDSISWIDFYDELGRCPSVKVGYGLLPKSSSVEEKKDRYAWCVDKFTPSELLQYLKNMKKYLKVDEIWRNYNSLDDALSLEPTSLDYDTQIKLISQFIAKEGYGPFAEIHPMSFTGEVYKEKFPVLVRK